MKTRDIGILLCGSMLTLPLEDRHRLSGKVGTENTVLPLWMQPYLRLTVHSCLNRNWRVLVKMVMGNNISFCGFTKRL